MSLPWVQILTTHQRPQKEFESNNARLLREYTPIRLKLLAELELVLARIQSIRTAASVDSNF